MNITHKVPMIKLQPRRTNPYARTQFLPLVYNILCSKVRDYTEPHLQRKYKKALKEFKEMFPEFVC
jgi:hypothetical protein